MYNILYNEITEVINMAKTENIMFRASSTLREIIEENAKNKNMSISEYIRRLVVTDSNDEQKMKIVSEELGL